MWLGNVRGRVHQVEILFDFISAFYTNIHDGCTFHIAHGHEVHFPLINSFVLLSGDKAAHHFSKCICKVLFVLWPIMTQISICTNSPSAWYFNAWYQLVFYWQHKYHWAACLRRFQIKQFFEIACTETHLDRFVPYLIRTLLVYLERQIFIIETLWENDWFSIVDIHQNIFELARDYRDLCSWHLFSRNFSRNLKYQQKYLAR